MLDLLAQSEHSVKDLTGGFSVSQPAISQHLGEFAVGETRGFAAGAPRKSISIGAKPLAPVMAWLAGGPYWAIQSKKGRE
jgi:hypothetical protein